MTVPTKDQLDRYMDLVVAGEDHEDAVLVVWGEEPTPKSPAKPDVMVTEFPDGIVIGWDTCSILNRGCGKSVKTCTCKGGPHSLKVFEKWYADPDTRPAYDGSVKAFGTTVTTATATPVLSPGDEPGRPSVDDLEPSLVPCVLGEHLVDRGSVDQNDDGTYSCFDCQVAGKQRGVQTDG